MCDVIFSMPAIYVYLGCLLVLLITALLSRPADPPGGTPRATAPTPPPQHDADPTGLSGGIPPRSPSGTARPFSDLQSTLSASYAARLEKAIRTIRPAGWATDD